MGWLKNVEKGSIDGVSEVNHLDKHLDPRLGLQIRRPNLFEFRALPWSPPKTTSRRPGRVLSSLAAFSWFVIFPAPGSIP